MNCFILGFQRRVWCPKWTPASSSCRLVTGGMVASFRFFLCPARWVISTGSQPDMRICLSIERREPLYQRWLGAGTVAEELGHPDAERDHGFRVDLGHP